MYGDQQGFAQMKLDYAETVEKHNVRIEIRRCWTIADAIALIFVQKIIDKPAYFRYDSARCQLTGCEQSHAFSNEFPRTTT